MTSSTILVKSTWLLPTNIGSTIRLASPGGGQTASRKIEPDSDARRPMICGETVAAGTVTFAGCDTAPRCESADAEPEGAEGFVPAKGLRAPETTEVG